jgi:hypothetical protein
MFRALYWKELRASWPFAVVALLAQGILCATCLEEAPINPISVFEEPEILHLLEILSVGFGFFLGLWQTFPESAMGTTEFLVQTARSRTAIVGGKLAAGLTLMAAALFVPLFITAALIIRRSSYFIPLTWADAAYWGVICWSGGTAYVWAVAIGLRGLPWKEGVQQIAGAAVGLLGIYMALISPVLGWAVAILGVTTVLAAKWAWMGFGAREF